MYGLLPVVRFLLERGASVHKTDKHLQNALHYATKTVDEAGVLALLVDAGGDVNCRDNLGRNVVHAAARVSHKKQLEYMIGLSGSKPVEVFAFDLQGRTPESLAHDVSTKVLFAMCRPVRSRPLLVVSWCVCVCFDLRLLCRENFRCVSACETELLCLCLSSACLCFDARLV